MKNRKLLRWVLGAMLVQSAFVFVVIVAPMGPRKRARFERHFAAQTTRIVRSVPSDESDRERYFRDVANLTRARIRVFDGQTRRGTYVPEDDFPTDLRDGLSHRAAIPAERGGGVLELTHPVPPPPTSSFVLTLVLVAMSIGVITFLLTKHVLSPLERLTEVMQRFRHGEFSARSGETRTDEIGELSKHFDRMAEEIEALLRSKDELLGAVAHELRTPLARVHVALDLMAATHRGDDALLVDTARSLRELEAVVDDVLLLARATSTSSPDSLLERVDLRTCLEHAVGEVRRMRDDESGVDLTLPNVSAEAVVPARLLERALRNVVENAVTHGASESPARVALVVRGERAVITVADHGPGMDTTIASRVFEPFFREDTARGRSTGGVGLGLALAKRFVELGRGTVALTTRPGEGTTVTIELPLATA